MNILGGADGFKADENVLVEDCWIHDLANACVQTGDEGAATEDLTVECNWLSGGGYADHRRSRANHRR